MHRIMVWAVAASLLASGVASADAVDPTAAWRPMYPFLGAWKGTRTEDTREVKVTRVYASAASNHHLEITEAGGGRAPAGVWGNVVFDAARPGLVLRPFASDGSAADLALDAAASTADQHVFTSPDSAGARTRITDTRAGWNAFVERIERAPGGGPFALVSETRFVRKD